MKTTIKAALASILLAAVLASFGCGGAAPTAEQTPPTPTPAPALTPTATLPPTATPKPTPTRTYEQALKHAAETNLKDGEQCVTVYDALRNPVGFASYMLDSELDSIMFERYGKSQPLYWAPDYLRVLMERCDTELNGREIYNCVTFQREYSRMGMRPPPCPPPYKTPRPTPTLPPTATPLTPTTNADATATPKPRATLTPEETLQNAAAMTLTDPKQCDLLADIEETDTGVSSFLDALVGSPLDQVMQELYDMEASEWIPDYYRILQSKCEQLR